MLFCRWTVSDLRVSLCGFGGTYIDSPEFLDCVERDDLLEQIIPVVALHHEISMSAKL